VRKIKSILLLLNINILCAICGLILINKLHSSESLIFVNDVNKYSQLFNSTNIITRYTDDFNGANDTNALKARGYLIYYRSTGPQGTSATWFQGNPSHFPAYNGPQNGYVAADFNVVTGQNNIDNWLVLPRIPGGILLNDIIYFYSRAEQNNPYVDSIRVMYSPEDSIPEGNWQEIGRYKVNTTGFWEQRGFKTIIPGINGRFAIRYCVANGGPSGQNSNYIGIDAISISTDTSKPVITHSKLLDIPKLNWPNQIRCQVTGPNGIDSVWVNWRSNTGSFKRFNLSNGSGTNWSGIFNSDTSQLHVRDSIFYRIIARSASPQHPLDSTELFKFTIFLAIGTGIIPSWYPFPGLLTDARTDMLYLSKEMAASEISQGSIRKIGFNVISIFNAPFTNFRVKLKTIADTSIYSFTSSGWTLCYDSSYLPLSTGWQFISLATPFYWNAGQNLLVEICFDLISMTQPFPVDATSMYGKMFGFYNNLPNFDGCASTTGLSIDYRPNIAFIIDPVIISNTGNKNYQIPDGFKLFQNYPNPFNPTTKIDYAISKNGFVSLKIYDVPGKELKTLVNENKNAGYYSIDFNGSEFPSGVYFYKLESNGFIDVKRMILIK
jgi:hypothetical protein